MAVAFASEDIALALGRAVDIRLDCHDGRRGRIRRIGLRCGVVADQPRNAFAAVGRCGTLALRNRVAGGLVNVGALRLEGLTLALGPAVDDA